MRTKTGAMLAVSMAFASLPAGAETPAETAAAFGAMEGVEQLSLSPDGSHIAFIAPSAGQGATLYTVAIDREAATPRPALRVSGKPDRLGRCNWVSDTRLACTIWGVVQSPEATMNYSRVFAVDADGKNQVMLSNRAAQDELQHALGGGNIVDWLPGQDGSVLMTRYYVPKVTIDSLARNNDKVGWGVDRVDTRTLAHAQVESPKGDAREYISDGHGTVRIMGLALRNGETGQDSGLVTYRYRKVNSREWLPLSTYDAQHRTGFNPFAVDSARDVAYGLEKQDGRLALVSKALDGSGTGTVLLKRPDVDITRPVELGRQQRVVGASYVTDVSHIAYFDPEIKALDEALRRALPRYPLVNIVDASVDETKLLIFAGADNDAGRYFVFDRKTKKLQVLMEVRPQLDGRTLATVKAITYPAADGTPIPAYLTMPPGGAARGLPTIVLPHGGPSARDEWGFDWLSQFYAARGYAVLQPEFRGSAGYGDAWFQDKGFKSWRIAIGDVNDAGRWLVAQGIADPKRLAIVGWSYGGYAALQSAVLDPGLFRVAVAIAPVTDLAALKEQYRNWSDFRLATDFIGSGPHVVEGSPAQNVDRITVPVMLVHGTLDANVRYTASTMMQSRLRSAGKVVELLSFPGLDHYLEDASARAQMLEKSDAFIRAAIGQ